MVINVDYHHVPKEAVRIELSNFEHACHCF